MAQNNRPQGREKKVTGGGSGVHRRGSGLGTGQVGTGSRPSGNGGSGIKRAAGGGGSLLIIIIAYLLLKGGVLGGEGTPLPDNSAGDTPSYSDSYSGSVDSSVANGSRAKRTQILGGNKDVVTVMLYLCGTDLESKHGMASADLEEIREASRNFGENFNLIVYTGGCKGWKSDISSTVNQIYQIKDGKIVRLIDDDGKDPMTSPDTLTNFIRYCSENFPANRNELILWDHGGGSVSGYGYDEKNSSKGSMNLAGIDKALRNSGVTFDFIGFDACLMATAENALMLDSYADYLIASEETEPGIGWYYTNWLTDFSQNTSKPTLDIGKNIVDDFVSECARKCRGQKTTLSVIDLAEFSNTIPVDLSNFASSISELISQDLYKEVSNARYDSREFATNSKIDQIDLADFAERMNNREGHALSQSIRSAVKYNRTSSNMTNANGVSIYFPYKRTSYVDSACRTYQQIGMDDEYAQCIRQFASVETSGQVAAGGTSSPVGSLFGIGSNLTGSGGNADVIGSLLNAFLSSGRSIEGLDSSNTDFMRAVDTDTAADYVSRNYFDPTNLVWENRGGQYIMHLPESQWELVHSIDMNMFYFDGEGYVDLGLDNIFTYTADGDLVADTDRNWVAVNGQVVAYYHTDTLDNNVNMGYIPAFLNGERVKLIVVFNGAEGSIAGAQTDYRNDETDTTAKNLTELKAGDELDFICDFYSADMTYQDSYYLGEPMTVTDDMQISNVDVGEGNVKITYRFTDIYDQEYWSEAIID